MAFLILPKENASKQAVINTDAVESIQFYYHENNKSGTISIYMIEGGEPIKYYFQDKQAEYEILKEQLLRAIEAKHL